MTAAFRQGRIGGPLSSLFAASRRPRAGASMNTGGDTVPPVGSETGIGRRTRPSGATAHAVRSVRYGSSPLLASRTPPWRSRLIVAVVGLGFCVLLGRAAYVQVVASDFFNRQGEMRFARTLELTASRGRITDRHGVLLATSVPAPSLWAVPKELNAALAAEPSRRRDLARALGLSVAELDDRLDGSPNFAWLRRQTDESQAKAVMALNLKGVHQVSEYKRRYPEGESMAPVVGFTNIEERGQEGIELTMESMLAGRDGSRQVLKDRLGRVVEDVGERVAAQDGRDIALSLDSKVQFFAYQRLRDAVNQHKARSGSAVVIDVKTGEVLAMANYPSFDPADRRSWNPSAMRNRVLTDTFEPGSTMKPFVIARALDSGRVRPDTRVATAPGSITITGATIRDAHPHGDLTVEQVVQKSSNVGTVKIAMQMERREMWELYSGVGFGQRPEVEFPGAVSGRLRPWKNWRPIEQATMSYGYGLSASLFQLAHAYTAFANDGRVIPVTLIRRADGEVPGAGMQPAPQVFSAQTAATMRHMLQLAAGDGGTAPKAQVDGYSVGGKTGTARKQHGNGYADGKYRAWFVGLAPASDPRLVVAVMIDEPSNGVYYAGLVAAPVFSAIVQQTLPVLGVRHDLDVRPGIANRQAPVTAVEEST
jgi:cell division protein FtsI (penicillin-binding protein 3)